MKPRTAELLEARKTIAGLDGKLRELQQKNKDIEEEFRREKNSGSLTS